MEQTFLSHPCMPHPWAQTWGPATPCLPISPLPHLPSFPCHSLLVPGPPLSGASGGMEGPGKGPGKEGAAGGQERTGRVHGWTGQVWGSWEGQAQGQCPGPSAVPLAAGILRPGLASPRGKGAVRSTEEKPEMKQSEAGLQKQLCPEQSAPRGLRQDGLGA